MKPMIKLILLLTLFSSFLIANNTDINFTTEEKLFIKNNPVIKVGAETDWPPFDFVENGKYTGLAKDYLEIIEKLTGLKFEYDIDTWSNLLKKAKNKELDLLPILSKTEERQKFLLYTNEYLEIRDYIFTNDPKLNSLEKVKDKVIVIPRGFVQEEYFKKNYPQIKIYYVNNLLEAIDSIITKKADFLVANVAIINYLLKKYNITELKATSHVDYSGSKLHMAVRNDYKILHSIIQKALDNISLKEKNIISTNWLNIKKQRGNSNLKLTDEELNFIKNKKRIIIANEFDWIPYDFNEDSQAKGYVIDYVKILAEKLGLEPIFVTDKWNNLLQKTRLGEIDILPVLTINKKREEFLFFTKSILDQKLSIITNKTRNDIINLDDLKNKKVAMMKGYASTNLLRKAFPKINVIEFDSLYDIFDAVKNNFVDATIQNNMIAQYYINKNYLEYLKLSSNVIIPNNNTKLHIGVKKDLKILRDLLNKAILSISKEELASLDNKWINFGKNINFTKEENDFIENTVIKVIASNNWGPYNFKDNGNIVGISADFWKYIVDKAKLKTKIIESDRYLEILNTLKSKENDITLSASITKDRKEYSIFSDTYLKSPIGIATLQDKNFIKDASMLLGKKIGVGKNFSAHKLLEEKYPNMNFVFVDSVEEGLNLLSKNEIYAFVDIMPVLTHNIKNYGYSNIKISGQTGIDFEVRFMIRDDYSILKSIINKVLNNMTLEDKKTIYNKWLEIPPQKIVDYSLLWKVISIFLLILLFVIYKNRQLVIYQKNLQETQKKLENSLENFKILIDLNVAGVLIIRDKKIKYLNNEIVNILGYSSKNELINKNISLLLDTEEIENLCSILANSESYEMTALSKNNKKIPVLLKGKEVKFDNLPSHIISLIDLTDIKNKEELMIQQSKMASLGEMIGNIAHQWRQPLSSISTSSSGLKLQKEFNQLTDQILLESLDNITNTTKFLSQTIDDFQNYIKEDKQEKEFDILNSIEKVLSLMKGSFVNSFIKVEKDIKSIIVNSYENELNQALLNILSNAKDALKNVNEEDRYIHISSYKKDNYAIIEIIDNGGGINQDIIKKVFEPYFTTKHKSQGTGLGLYMTHKILTESINGTINIENCNFNEYKNCTKLTLSIPLF